jgi:hypothetical protein
MRFREDVGQWERYLRLWFRNFCSTTDLRRIGVLECEPRPSDTDGGSDPTTQRHRNVQRCFNADYHVEFLRHDHSDRFIIRLGDGRENRYGNNLRNDYVVIVLRIHQSFGSNYGEPNTATFRVLCDGKLAGHTDSGEKRDGIRP